MAYQVLDLGHQLFAAWFAASCLLLVFVFIRTHLQFATICVDERGVHARRFGLTWRSIAWNHVRRIARIREYDPVSRSAKNYYYIFDSKLRRNANVRKLSSNMHNGPIMFSDQIEELNNLVGVVNEHSLRHGIELVAVDRVADAAQATTLWRKMEPVEQEHKIARL